MWLCLFVRQQDDSQVINTNMNFIFSFTIEENNSFRAYIQEKTNKDKAAV